MARLEPTKWVNTTVDAIGPSFFPSTCTIQQHDGSRLGSGQPDPNGWSNLANHVDLPCRKSTSIAREESDQRKISYRQVDAVLLRGNYSLITDEMRAILDSVTYKITGVKSDGSAVLTKVTIETVKP